MLRKKGNVDIYTICQCNYTDGKAKTESLHTKYVYICTYPRYSNERISIYALENKHGPNGHENDGLGEECPVSYGHSWCPFFFVGVWH